MEISFQFYMKTSAQIYIEMQYYYMIRKTKFKSSDNN